MFLTNMVLLKREIKVFYGYIFCFICTIEKAFGLIDLKIAHTLPSAQTRRADGPLRAVFQVEASQEPPGDRGERCNNESTEGRTLSCTKP